MRIRVTMVFAAEALLVPAYTINLGKRLWSKTMLDLPAMSLGIRQAKRTRDEFERELAMHQLRERLKLLESGMEICEPEVEGAVAAERQASQDASQEKWAGKSAGSEMDLIREAKACLMV